MSLKTVGEKLLDEIERVGAKRERWKRYAMDSDSPASFAPTLYLMTQSIEAAKRALTSFNAVECIACLKDLEGYDSDD